MNEMREKFCDKVGMVTAFAGAAGAVYLFALRSFISLLSQNVTTFGYDDVMFFAMQAMVVVSLIGSLNAYRKHRNVFPPMLAIASAAAVIYGINSQLDIYFMFPGMLGMLAVSLWNSVESGRVEQEVD